MNYKFNCIFLVLYHVIFNVAGFPTQRRQGTKPFSVVFQNPIAQSPNTEAIEKWHDTRQQIMLDLMERQRQMDEKKADAVRQIAELRANRLQAHHELQKKQIHPDMFLTDSMTSKQHQQVNHQQFANNMLASQFVPVNDIKHTTHNQIDHIGHGLDWTQSTRPVQDLDPRTNRLNDIGLAQTQIRFVSNDIGSTHKNVQSHGNEVFSQRNIVQDVKKQNRKGNINELSTRRNIPDNTHGISVLPVEHSTMGQFDQTASFTKSSSSIAHSLGESVTVSSHSVVDAGKNSTTPVNHHTVPDVTHGDSSKHTDTSQQKLPMDKQNKHVLSEVSLPSKTSTTTSSGIMQPTVTDGLTTDNTTLSGVLSQPVDIILHKPQKDIGSDKGNRINDSKGKTIGPDFQKQAIDEQVNEVRKTENIVKHPTGIDRGSTIESTTKIVEKVNDKHLHPLTNASRPNSSIDSNRDRATLMNILNILNVSTGVNQNITTTKLLRDENIQSILAKTVQDLSRLLSVDTQQSSPRVDVFHHIHVHHHDPHELPGSVPSSTDSIIQPGITVNEMPVVDLTLPSHPVSHMDSVDFLNSGTLHSDKKTSTRKFIHSLQSSGVGADLKDIVVDNNMSDSGFILNGSLGTPADELTHVDIIELLSGKDMQSVKKGLMSNVESTISDEATTQSRGIKTMNGDTLPMPQTAPSSPSTGKTVSALSFLTDIRTKLKKFKNRIIKPE